MQNSRRGPQRQAESIYDLMDAARWYDPPKVPGVRRATMKSVLRVLTDYVRCDAIYPSISTIAELACIESDRTVQAAVCALLSDGVITRTLREGTSPVYAISYEALMRRQMSRHNPRISSVRHDPMLDVQQDQGDTDSRDSELTGTRQTPATTAPPPATTAPPPATTAGESKTETQTEAQEKKSDTSHRQIESPGDDTDTDEMAELVRTARRAISKTSGRPVYNVPATLAHRVVKGSYKAEDRALYIERAADVGHHKFPEGCPPSQAAAYLAAVVGNAVLDQSPPAVRAPQTAVEAAVQRQASMTSSFAEIAQRVHSELTGGAVDVVA